MPTTVTFVSTYKKQKTAISMPGFTRNEDFIIVSCRNVYERATTATQVVVDVIKASLYQQKNSNKFKFQETVKFFHAKKNYA